MSPGVVRRTVSAVAFDVDGTIADTDPIHGAAWAKALQSIAGRSFPVADYLAACVDGAMAPRAFVGRYASLDDWPAVEREKRRIYPAMLRADGRLTKGLARLLSQADAADVSTIIVSSSSRESVDTIMRTLWVGAAPAATIVRGDSDTEKPSPSPYVTALDRLQLPASAVVAFEDSASGVASATAAGILCVQVGRTPTPARLRVDDFDDCSIDTEIDGACLTIRTR